MYCTQCGTVVPENAVFCPECGKDQKSTHTSQNTISTQNAINDDIESLTRRANAYIDQYVICPDVEWARMLSNWKDVFEFNPLFLVQRLKNDLLRMLMNVTEYSHDETFFYPVIEKTYNARYNSMLEVLKNYFHDLLVQFCSQGEFKYTFYINLEDDLHYLFICSKSFIDLCVQTNDTANLFEGLSFARAAEYFYIDASSSGTWQIQGIKRSGTAFSTSQYYQDAQYFRQLYQFVETTLQQMNPEGAKAVEQLHANIAKESKSKFRKHAVSILIKTIFVLFTPLMLYINYLISPFLDIDYSTFPIKLILIVGGILFIVAIIQSFVIKNSILSSLFDIVLWCLLYPICWIITAAVQLIVLVIILLVLCFVGGSRSSYI